VHDILCYNKLFSYPFPSSSSTSCWNYRFPWSTGELYSLTVEPYRRRWGKPLSGFTIFHGLWPGRHHFLWAHKVRDCLLNSFAASSLDKEQKLISFLPRPNSFQQHKNIVNGLWKLHCGVHIEMNLFSHWKSGNGLGFLEDEKKNSTNRC